MKNLISNTLTASIIVSSLFTLLPETTHAQPAISKPANAVSNTSVSNRNIFIPKNTAIVIKILENHQLDAGQNKHYSTTFLLASPILNNNGYVIVPSNSPVQGKIITGEGKAEIVVESLVINGKVVPVNTQSVTITGTKVTTVSRTQKAQKISNGLSRFASSVVGVFGGNSDEIIQGGFGGNATGILAGVLSPDQVSVVQINQGSTYVLTLQKSVY